MTTPYYQDDTVTLYHGDARDITEWLDADVLLTDPPYGRGWRQGDLKKARNAASDTGIANDKDATVRDAALALWGQARPAIVFGDLMLAPPAKTKLTAIYSKPGPAGYHGTTARIRRDAEAIYFIGPHPSGIGGRSSIFTTAAANVGGASGIVATSGGHPHAKPTDLLTQLLTHLPPGTVADPFAGSGSTLVAAKAAGRRAIGVELDERYCEMAARRLAQDVLTFDEWTA